MNTQTKESPVVSGAKKHIRNSLRKNKVKSLRGASAVVGMATWVPDEVVKLSDISEKIKEKTSIVMDLEGKTGVVSRRQISSSTSVLDMAMNAVNKLLFDVPESTTQDIDLIIYCGVTREYIEPATATLIHNELGIQNATAFDITNACLGFVDGMCIADSMIASGTYNKVLLVSAEIGSVYAEMALQSIVNGEDPRNHFASLTLGDGACAYLMESAINAPIGSPVLQSYARASYGEFSDLCIIQERHLPMITRPVELFGAALSKFSDLVDEVLDECGWGVEKMDLYVGHQASLRSIEKGERVLGVKEGSFLNTITEYGNMASVSVPFTMAQGLKGEAAAPGARTLIVGFGSGLGVGVLTLENARGES